MTFLRRLAFVLAALALVAPAMPAAAQSAARARTLTCSDGTVFVGEQVRQGFGQPPSTWRNVEPGAFPAAFVFHASAVAAPDGTVVEEVTYDHTQGVARNHELVTCGFIIPIGVFEGYRAEFVGYFVP